MNYPMRIHSLAAILCLLTACDKAAPVSQVQSETSSGEFRVHLRQPCPVENAANCIEFEKADERSWLVYPQGTQIDDADWSGEVNAFSLFNGGNFYRFLNGETYSASLLPSANDPRLITIIQSASGPEAISLEESPYEGDGSDLLEKMKACFNSGSRRFLPKGTSIACERIARSVWHTKPMPTPEVSACVLEWTKHTLANDPLHTAPDYFNGCHDRADRLKAILRRNCPDSEVRVIHTMTGMKFTREDGQTFVWTNHSALVTRDLQVIDPLVFGPEPIALEKWFGMAMGRIDATQIRNADSND